MISYAQNFEDVMLWRALGHVKRGFYIDVGANDATVDSVTRFFYEQGWRGINIEPVGQWYKQLEQQRPRDINLQLAAGAEQGEFLLYEIPDTGLSTTSKTIAEQHKTLRGLEAVESTVKVRALTDICQDYHVAPIHFLKIDVEGAEKQVLEGLDLTLIRPWIILVESTLPGTEEESFADWEPALLAADYAFVWFDGLNRYYVANEKSALKDNFVKPVNIFDGFQMSGQGTSPLQQQVGDNNLHNQQLANQLVQSEDEKVQLNAQLDQVNVALAETKQQQAQQAEQLSAEQLKTEQLSEQHDQANVALAETKQQKEHQQAQQAEQLSAEQLKTEQLSAQLDQANEASAEKLRLVSELRGEQAVLQNKLDELNHSSHHWWTTAQALEAQKQQLIRAQDTLQAKVDELNFTGHHWWARADVAEQRVTALEKSLSWRITLPLRLPLALLMLLFRSGKRGLIAIIKWPFTWFMSVILKRPILAKKVNQRLLNLPWLHHLLVQQAKDTGLYSESEVAVERVPEIASVVTGSPTELVVQRVINQEENIDFDRFNRGSIDIYQQLKVALELKQKEIS
jgi:FkbM family methyltransferase